MKQINFSNKILETLNMIKHLYLKDEYDEFLMYYSKAIKYLKILDDEYYNKNNSLVEDTFYDIFKKSLKQFTNIPEKLKNELEKVGSNVNNTKFVKIHHKYKMLSLDNARTFDELEKWIKKTTNGQTLELSIQHKLDGMSFDLEYENGVLKKGISRGNGNIGEDLTSKTLYIKNIPEIINNKEITNVYGELIIKISDYDENCDDNVNKILRNFASGSMRLIDLNEFKKRNICFIAHGLQKRNNILSETEELDLLFKNGFEVVNNCIFNNEQLENIFNYCKKCENDRNIFDYIIDGLVIKICSNFVKNKLGIGNTCPKWAIAYKFPPMKGTTIVESIDYQIGSSGRITPVANLKPLKLDGVTISRCTLHNIDFMIELGNLMPGDEVLIQRSCDVIPQIISISKHVENKNLKEMNIPTNCQICGTKLIKETSKITICPNELCHSRIYKRFINFCSRNCMNIYGLGQMIIKQLYKKGIIKTFSDIYKLDKEKILMINRSGDLLAEKIINSIEQSKNVNLLSFLSSLQVPSFGKTLFEKILTKYKTIDEIINLSKNDLLQFDGFGDIVINNYINFFKKPEIINEINEFKKIGLKCLNEEFQIDNGLKIDSEFNNKTFIVTGKFEKMTRIEIENMFMKLGAIKATSVNKNLDFLIVGDKPGSKLDKAQTISNIIIIDEIKFEKIYDEYKDII